MNLLTPSRQAETPARQTQASARQTQASARQTQASARQTQASARQTQASVRQTQAWARQTQASVRRSGTPVGTNRNSLQLYIRLDFLCPNCLFNQLRGQMYVRRCHRLRPDLLLEPF